MVVNVSDFRCDALIIDKRGFRAIRLPHLHSRDIRTREVSLGGLNSALLEWLWDTITNPVLEALELTQAPPGASRPRIWWVPTGPLARFPLHAAGYDGSSNRVLDRVISSYSSSAKALMQGQRKAVEEIPKKSGNAVLVGMKTTTRHGYLPYAMEEVEKLSTLCQSMHLDVRRPPANQGDILSALRDCSIFRFADRGLTDSSDPFEKVSDA